MEQLEEGELETESLEELISKHEGEEADFLQESLDPSGNKKRFTRKTKRVPLPKDVQELQTRHKVMAHCHGYPQTKRLSVGWLQTTSLKLWERFTSYLTGEKVLLLKVPTSEGTKSESPRPDWALVLNYEREIRKKCNELIQEDGLDLAAALTKAWNDTELRGLHFITPYLRQCTMAAYMPLPAPKIPGGDYWRRRGGDRFQPYKGQTMDGHGKGGKTGKQGKDGKGGKGKAGDKDAYGALRNGRLASSTPAGAWICYKHNKHDANDKCDASCGMEHCCRVQGCFKKDCQAYRCNMLSKEMRQSLVITPV